MDRRPWLITLALALLAGPVRAQQAPCGPAVQLSGDADLREALGAALAARGISDHAQPGCPALHASVIHLGAMVSVSILAEAERSSTRDLGDVDAAATYIESWVRNDISAPLLLARPVAIPQAPASSPRPAPAPAPVRMIVREAKPRFAVGASFEVAGAIDRSVWIGGSAFFCSRMGPACLGVLLRSAGSVYDAGMFPRASRVATDLFFAVGFPINLVASRRVRLEPGLGLGVGWMQTKVDLGPPGRSVVDTLDFGGLRAEASLRALVLLGHGLLFSAGLSLDAAFLSVSSVKAMIPPPAPPGSMTDVPGPPWGLLRAALGLRWSTP